MWESRDLGEISKSLWKPFCGFHRDGISTAADERATSSDSPPVPRGREAPRAPIDAAQFHVHEADEPIAAFRFHESDGFAPNRFADKHQLAAPFDLPGRPHAAHLVRGVPRLLEPCRVGSGRGHIDARGRLLSKRFVGTLRIKLTAEPIKAYLLLSRCRGRRRRGLFLQRQMKSLMAPILLGMAGRNPIQLNAELQPPHRQLRQLPWAVLRKNSVRPRNGFDCRCVASRSSVAVLDYLSSRQTQPF